MSLDNNIERHMNKAKMPAENYKSKWKSQNYNIFGL